MSALNDRLAIEFISVMGMPPVDFILLAGDLGVGHIGIAPEPILQENPCGFPAWSLREDTALRRETTAALRDTGVRLSVGEGFLLWPGADAVDCAGDLDLMQELGVPVVNILSLDPDVARTFDQLARFAEMAKARAMRAVTEFLPGVTLATLDQAIAAAHHAGDADLGILIDTMHFFRSGSMPADLATIDPALIGYIQVCDVPLKPVYDDYAHEAQYDRKAPGDGDLPLAAFLTAAPIAPAVGLELPRLAQAKAGMRPREWLADALAKASTLLGG